jgi:hypothetical protein
MSFFEEEAEVVASFSYPFGETVFPLTHEEGCWRILAGITKV